MSKIHHICLFCLFVVPVFFLSGCMDIGGKSPWGWSVPDSSKAGGESAVVSNRGVDSQIPPVKVAILLPLSGSKAALGHAMLQSAQLAVFDVGFDSFELIPYDTAGTPRGAAAAASMAIEAGAGLILGPVFSDSVRAVKSVATRKNVNMIAFSTNQKLAGGNTFVMGFLPSNQIRKIVEYALQDGISRVVVIAPKDRYGELATNLFRKYAAENGIDVVDVIRFRAGDGDIADRIGRLAGTDFDAAFVPAPGPVAGRVVSSLNYYGFTRDKVKLLGTGLWDDRQAILDPMLQGGVFAAPSLVRKRGFEKNYKSVYGVNPPRIASLAYDATALSIVLARSGFKKKSANPFSREAITAEGGFNGNDGVFRFTSSGLVERKLAIIGIDNKKAVTLQKADMSFSNRWR